MAKHKNPKKPTKETHQNQNLQHPHIKSDTTKPPPWAVMRGIFACKDLQTQQQQILQHQKQKQQKQKQQQQQLQEPKQKQQKQEKSLPPQQHQKQKQQQSHQPQQEQEAHGDEASKKYKKMKCSGSLCSNTKVMHRPELSASPEVHKRSSRALASSSSNSSSHNNDTASSSRSMKAPLRELNGRVVPSTNSSSFSAASSSNSSSIGGSFRAMPFRRFSGCYECRMVVDPVLGFTRDPSLRATICSCPECGEIFMKPENLELHQAVRHAVSELGPEDTSKNIVEIIFQSSWLKKQTPICKIDRILKVQNTQRTITRFEEYRDSIKAKANRLAKKHPRCVADGNELLRFHCTTFACSLGLNGSSNLCNSIPQCGACSIIKNGFRVVGELGILTTATSGKAHDKAGDQGGDGEGGEKRAMLVCRVIAGRVKKNAAESGAGAGEEYDSVGGGGLGVYSNLDELYVFNPKAILPCFVVIYTGF